MKHELQYGDKGPDWCIHCGTFAHNIRNKDEECSAKEPRRFDNTKPESFERVVQGIFGESR